MNEMVRAIDLQLDLRFADGTDRRVVVRVRCEGSELSPAATQLRVPDLPTGADVVPERVLEAVSLAIDTWCSRHGVCLSDDPTPEIVAALGLEIVSGSEPPPVGVVTARQRANFARFEQWEYRHSAAELACAVINVDGLNPSDLGLTWGVTVFPSARTSLRLNVGGREVLAARSNGAATLFLLADPGPFASLPPSAERTKGFNGLPGSTGLTVVLDEAMALLEIPAVLQQHRALVEASLRPLPKPNWHNPLIEPLLQQTGPAGQQVRNSGVSGG